MKGNDLRVVTWNCAMALRRKLPEIASFKTDILVLQECARSDVDHLASVGLALACWTGSNSRKGLALAAKSSLKLKASPVRGIQWAIRGDTGDGTRLGVVATWACATQKSEERYIRQIHKLLDRGILADLPRAAIVLGDFNSNSIWDAEHRDMSHSKAVEKFERAGYRSAYHHARQEIHGKESAPTFFLYRDRNRPYHIDYAFLSHHLRRKVRAIEIGAPAKWLQFSDHMPVRIDFRLSGASN